MIRVGNHGSWRLIANLSRFERRHPVANPDPEDFEPDGTWYSMTSAGGALYPMDSNHGELDRVTPRGHIHRVVDISAQLGHVVPTAIAPVGGHHRPAFVIGNLGVFGAEDGTTPNEHVFDLSRGGHISPCGPPGSSRSSAWRSAAAACTRSSSRTRRAGRCRPRARSCA